MQILDETEIRNKEEDEVMRKIHLLRYLPSDKYYDAVCDSYHREKYWHTDEYKDVREMLRIERLRDLQEECENNDITEKDFNEGIAEINGVLPEGTTIGVIEEIENRDSCESEQEYECESEHGYERAGWISEDDWDVENAAIYEKTDECYCGCNENKYICLYTPVSYTHQTLPTTPYV